MPIPTVVREASHPPQPSILAPAQSKTWLGILTTKGAEVCKKIGLVALAVLAFAAGLACLAGIVGSIVEVSLFPLAASLYIYRFIPKISPIVYSILAYLGLTFGSGAVLATVSSLATWLAATPQSTSDISYGVPSKARNVA